MANEIARFDDLNLFFFLFILSEPIFTCVIGFNSFMKILDDQWKW